MFVRLCVWLVTRHLVAKMFRPEWPMGVRDSELWTFYEELDHNQVFHPTPVPRFNGTWSESGVWWKEARDPLLSRVYPRTQNQDCQVSVRVPDFS